MNIWKWKLEVMDRQTVMLPAGAKLLDVQVQHVEPALWALCDPAAELEPRHLAIYGTGTSVPESAGEYVATFQLFQGNLVFHVFEVAAL